MEEKKTNQNKLLEHENISFDFSDFKCFEDKIKNINKTTTENQNTWRYCKSCNMEAIEEISTAKKMLCPKCGVEFPYIYDDKSNFNANMQHNTSPFSYNTTKIEGKNSYIHNKTLQISCSNYNLWNAKKAVRYLNRCSYESDTDKIPPYINEAVINEFEKIRKRKTFRGPVQMGIKAVLAYYMCPVENLARKPSEIAKLHGIMERDLSRADSIVREFIEEGIINLQINQNNYESFVERYMAILEIDPKWKKIIIDIIERAEKKHIYVHKSPKLSTKCMGSIFLIINSVPDLKKKISKDEISDKCNISKTTFMSQYQLLLLNKKKIRKVFRKYKLNFPEK